MSPLEQSWAFLKADAFLYDDSPMGQFLSQGADPMNRLGEQNPLMYGQQGATAVGREMLDLNDYRNSVGQPLAYGIVNPNSMAVGRNQTSNIQYYRGGSMPRTNQRGNFVGVNVASPSFDWNNAFDKAVQDFAETAAHENVHDLIDEEVSPWAKEQSGAGQFDAVLAALRKDRWRKGMDAGMDASVESLPLRERIRARLKAEQVTPPPSEAERKLRELAEQRLDNEATLRSLAHEFGAFSGERPDSSPFEVRQRMLNYEDIQPYVQYSLNPDAEGAIDPATLHANPAFG